MLGMKTETRRGLVAAGAALIALITLAILSPTPQLYMWYTTQNGLVTLGVTYFVYDLYSDYGGPGLFLFAIFTLGLSMSAALILTFGVGAAIIIAVA
jgi:hypothetical protein